MGGGLSGEGSWVPLAVGGGSDSCDAVVGGDRVRAASA